MKLFTIGFTKTTAESFFGRLKGANISSLLDVRLNNVSQLAGFAKRDDLRFFLRELVGVSYAHEPRLAPTQEMLDAYRKAGGDWRDYEARFMALIAERRIEDGLSRDALNGACLLCSEDKPHRCHRRLVAEYLKGRWGDVDIVHL